MQWYYAEDGAQKGPVEEAVLEQLIAAGTVRGDTLVWQEGMENWERCDKVRGFAPPPITQLAGCAHRAADRQCRLLQAQSKF